MKSKRDTVVQEPLNLIISTVSQELWLLIANHLEFDDISALTSTYQFFPTILNQKGNIEFKKQLLNIKNNKRQYIAAYSKIIFLINGRLFVCKNDYEETDNNQNQYSFVECQIELKQGERITNIAIGVDYILVKTKSA